MHNFKVEFTERVVLFYWTKVVYSLGVLAHFVSWDIFGFWGISTFSPEKVRQEKFTKFAKIWIISSVMCHKLEQKASV